MSKPGRSWLPMPVTETVLPVISKILTSEPARPPCLADGTHAEVGTVINEVAFHRGQWRNLWER